MHKRSLHLFKKHAAIVCFLLFSLLFSTWLMAHTFAYRDGNMQIASKAWSDFGSHIPLIRSFTYGDNFPPQYPLFPGEPIRYHFLFYAIVGLLEKIGIRIDYAFNGLSILSFWSLLVGIFFLGKQLFKKTSVGLLAVLFFLFNGSLSFLDFFKTHPLSSHTIQDIVTVKNFPAFGPYNGSDISAFWNLNIYTNQRHLGLSFALILFIIILYYTNYFAKRKQLLTSIYFVITFLLIFLNQGALLLALLFIGWFFVIQPKKNYLFLLVFLNLFFAFFFFPHLSHTSDGLKMHLGFLMQKPITIFSFLSYWFLNIGLSSILLPFSYFFAPKKIKLLFIPMLFIFTLANIFQFSPDIINNHKFFNFFLIVANVFTANFIISAWRSFFVRPFIVLVCFLLTFSGIIDFMVIKNDHTLSLLDIPKNKDALFFLEQTNPKDIILSNTSFLSPASIAGRPVFFGYSYFPWSYGYDIEKRETLVQKIFSLQDKEQVCQLLQKNAIAYIAVTTHSSDTLSSSFDFWRNNFREVYRNNETGMEVFNTKASCKILPIEA